MLKPIDLTTYTKLNLACGPIERNHMGRPWLNVDLKCDFADLQMNVHALPEEWTDSFWEVRASHVLEHFFIKEWPLVLSEWLRVLRPGGVLRISMPDLDKVVDALRKTRELDMKGRRLLSLEEPTFALMELYGAGYEDANYDPRWRHRISTNAPTLVQYLGDKYDLNSVDETEIGTDTARLHNVRDDSRSPWNMTVSATLAGKNLGIDFEQMGLVDQPESHALQNRCIIINRHGQLLIQNDKSGWQLPVHDATRDEVVGHPLQTEQFFGYKNIAHSDGKESLYCATLKEAPAIDEAVGLLNREFVFLEESVLFLTGLDKEAIEYLLNGIS